MTINQLEKAYKILIDEINGKDKKLNWNIRYAIFGYLYGDKMQKHSSKDLNAMCEKLKKEGYNASNWTKDFKCLSNIKEKGLLEKEYTILTLDELERQWKKLEEISIGDVTYKGYAISLLFSSSFEDLNVIKSFAERVVSRDRGFKDTINHIQRGKVLREWIMNKGFNRSKTVEELESVGDVLGSQEAHKNDSLEKLKPYSHNRILFGAPGTGKSHRLELDSKYFDGRFFERVTFHPDYSYAHFVGTYKPVMRGENIKYDFVPGPFLRIYAKTKLNPDTPCLLLIEEINRANVAAVFGDVFQLLDRKGGVSEYKVAASEDVKKWLSDNGINETELSLPENMYIWATMNSADQGVFPMDTAFKRRWNFEYIDLDEGEDLNAPPTYWSKWLNFRKTVNGALISAGVNEDKCMGPFFVNPKELNEWLNNDDFRKMFASKVVMYLFEDAAKQKRASIFKDGNKTGFSSIYNNFLKKDYDQVFVSQIVATLNENNMLQVDKGVEEKDD